MALAQMLLFKIMEIAVARGGRNSLFTKLD